MIAISSLKRSFIFHFFSCKCCEYFVLYASFYWKCSANCLVFAKWPADQNNWTTLLYAIEQRSATYGPFTKIVVTVWSAYSGIIFHESAPLATFCIEYLRGTIYEKPHGTIRVLYVAFWTFVMNCENQELI